MLEYVLSLHETRALKNGDRKVVAPVNSHTATPYFNDQNLTHTLFSSFALVLYVLYIVLVKDMITIPLYYNHDHVVLHCLFGLCSKENSTKERLGQRQQEQQSTKYKNYCTYIIVYWCTTTTLTTKTNSYSKDHQGLIKRWIQLIKYFKWRVLDDKKFIELHFIYKVLIKRLNHFLIIIEIFYWFQDME